jgi:hypothetical protein
LQTMPFGWEALWAGGLKPGQAFDAKVPLPFVDTLLAAEGLVPRGKGIIPGFGRGYDIAAFASEERHITGVELAPSAVKAASEYLAAKDVPHEWFELVTGSFFDFPGQGEFDFAYDYTMLCALEPELRQAWADTYARLLRDGGVLITVVFPIKWTAQRPPGSGPPFDMTLELVSELLLPRDFKPIFSKALGPGEAHVGRDGAEGAIASTTVVVWQKHQTVGKAAESACVSEGVSAEAATEQ